MHRVLLAAALLALLLPGAAIATPERTTLPDVEDEVMCPVCGTPLNLAESTQADRERAFIRGLIARGDSKAQIKRRLVDQYGPEVLATPSARGFDLTAYLVPILLGLVGLAIVAVAAARWRRRGPAATSMLDSPAPLTPADARRLDEDLARYDG